MKAIVEEIIDLYAQGKIPLLATAEKLLDNITSLNKKKRDKGIEDFKKKKDSYYSAKSVIGRLEKEIQDFKDKDIQDFDIEYLAFVEVDEKVYNSIKSSQMRKNKMNGRFYKQSSSWLKALVKAPSPVPSSLYKKHIPRYDEKGEPNPLFETLLAILNTNDVVKKHGLETQSDPPDMYYIEHSDILLNKRAEYKPTKSYAKSAGVKTSLRYRYISTELDLSKETFKQAIEIKNYVDNECWINSFIDFFGNLFSVQRQEPLTRERLLHSINKTEDDMKHGICIDDMLPLYIEYRLSLRVYDYKTNLIFQYDPVNKNKNHKTMYVLQHDGHIYTLNHDLKALAQQLKKEHKINVQVSSDYLFQFNNDEQDI